MFTLYLANGSVLLTLVLVSLTVMATYVSLRVLFQLCSGPMTGLSAVRRNSHGSQS